MIHCDEYDVLSRRGALHGGLRAVGRMLGAPQLDLPERALHLTFADPHVGPRGDTLVCIFLRGGADGLNVLVPHGDEDYYRARPTIAIPRPDANAATPTLDLDGFFGLHPSLQPLIPIYQAGALAPVTATGSPDESRSHFQAMAEMERASFGGGEYSGWLARHLAALDTGSGSALRALAVGEMLPASLAGAGRATVLRAIDEYRLTVPDEDRAELAELLEMLYAQGEDRLTQAGRGTLASVEALARIDTASAPQGRPYPENAFGQAMHTVSRLIRAEVGVEVACVDLGGWDTHAAQGAGEGYMAGQLTTLGEGLAAFYEDLADRMGSVTVVVMSEFGRRVKENAALGTDHGTGSMMLLLGENVSGGRVHGAWPGLNPDLLIGPGDVAITTDYRHVLAEVVTGRLNNPLTELVFPGFSPQPVGVVGG